MIFSVLTIMFFVSCSLISCGSSNDSLEETHYIYDAISAKTAFCNAVGSITEEFLINRAIAERQGSMKSDFFESYHTLDYSIGYVLYGWNIVRINHGPVETEQYRKDIIVTFDEKTGTYYWRVY